MYIYTLYIHTYIHCLYKIEEEYLQDFERFCHKTLPSF